jgi:hypothetical protein
MFITDMVVRYLRRITPAAVLGYVAGVATLLLQTQIFDQGHL